jgi:hypothetical protein
MLSSGSEINDLKKWLEHKTDSDTYICCVWQVLKIMFEKKAVIIPDNLNRPFQKRRKKYKHITGMCQ